MTNMQSDFLQGSTGAYYIGLTIPGKLNCPNKKKKKKEILSLSIVS